MEKSNSEDLYFAYANSHISKEKAKNFLSSLSTSDMQSILDFFQKEKIVEENEIIVITEESLLNVESCLVSIVSILLFRLSNFWNSNSMCNQKPS